MDALWRQSLIERGQGASFTLQSVVMEYVTDALLDQLTGEIVTQAMDHLHRYAVEQAQAKDYVREIQVRLLVRPLAERLRAELGSDTRVEEQCLSLLMHLRVDYEKLADKHNVEDSKTNRARVMAAREWQLERFKGTKCIKFTPELFIRERG